MKKTNIAIALSLAILSCPNLYSDPDVIAEKGGGDHKSHEHGNHSGDHAHKGDTKMERTNKNDAAAHEHDHSNNNRAGNNYGGGYNNAANPEVIVAPGYQNSNNSTGVQGK